MSLPGETAKDKWRVRNAVVKANFIAHSPNYKQLYNLLHQKDTSAVDCAQPFIDRTIKIAASPEVREELNEFVGPFAWAIVEMVAHTSYKNTDIQSKLVDFIHELQKAVVTDPTGEPLSYNENEDEPSVLWTNLPMFRMCCSEEMISFDEDDPKNTELEKERWKNLSAFWAGLSRSKATDFIMHGLHACLNAFGPYDSPSPNETKPIIFIQQIACIWFIFAADTLWHTCQEGTENRNRESWKHWTKGVEEFKDADGDAETQRLVDRALEMIQKAERLETSI
ncbi:hypothetical protein DM02DRAFT_631658 [Periconia macrospinosa]|uniref:Uncharacterized protein n=1 Tax=Periconia macrospinosa TaxID=97972 RepID=A0A2V1DFM9_9PLEO|nr:hypothetical protein DM02DRAFT_631658 [Periconia macrospinosa]